MKYIFEKSKISSLSIEIAMSKAQILRGHLLSIGYSSDEITYGDELFVQVFYANDKQKNEIINLGKDNETLWYNMTAYGTSLNDGKVIFIIRY